MVKTVQISRPITFEPTGAVAQLLERSGDCGFDPRPSHTIDCKMVLAALSFALSIEKAELVGPVSV